jgi:hypothetical protein
VSSTTCWAGGSDGVTPAERDEEYVGGRTSTHASALPSLAVYCSQAKLLSKDKKIARLKTVANYLLSTVTSENLDHLKRELADLVKTKACQPLSARARLYATSKSS